MSLIFSSRLCIKGWGSDLEDALEDEVDDDKSFFWLAAEGSEYVWDYFDDYVSEEWCDRDNSDCPGGDNIGAYCNSLQDWSKRDLEDFLSDADLFADEYEDEVEDENYEYDITDRHGRDYDGGLSGLL